MNDAQLEVLQDYVEKINNQRACIDGINKNCMAPPDGARGVEAQLRRFLDAKRDEVLFILAQEILSREMNNV